MKTLTTYIFMIVWLVASVVTNAQVGEGTSNAITIKAAPRSEGMIDKPGAISSGVSRNFALIIGVDEYQDPSILPLSEPWNDANKLKNTLVNLYTFDEMDIEALHNPTYVQLHIAFEEMASKITPSDNLLIFFAGHGYYDEEKHIGYWLPSDAQKSNRAKWYRNSALVEDVGSINSQHTLLIADACFAGGIFKTREPFDNLDKNIANLMRKTSRQAITSGALTEVPDQSVFMKYLIKSLEENNKKYLVVEDLFYNLVPAVKSNSETRPLFGTIQNVGDEGGNFVFVKK